MNSSLRQYGASLNSIIAANKNVPDVEFLYKGQLPNVPAFVLPDTQSYQVKRSGYSSFYHKQRPWSSVASLGRFLRKEPCIMLPAKGLPHVKPTGHFLVLVPVIVFCITCILGAFHTGCRAVDESGKDDERRSMRWKNALNDMKEPDDLDSESRTDIKNTSEDEVKNLNEDMSHAYRILEQDYQKFLSECGMSKSGYWRGGIRK